MVPSSSTEKEQLGSGWHLSLFAWGCCKYSGPRKLNCSAFPFLFSSLVVLRHVKKAGGLWPLTLGSQSLTCWTAWYFSEKRVISMSAMLARTKLSFNVFQECHLERDISGSNGPLTLSFPTQGDGVHMWIEVNFLCYSWDRLVCLLLVSYSFHRIFFTLWSSLKAISKIYACWWGNSLLPAPILPVQY